MKSFKNYMAEVAEPKSSEEKKFKDMHQPEVKPHPVAEPTQHKAEKPKAKRKADQEGDANYDKAYTTEDAEQIDEISKGLAGRYIKKAQMDTAHAGDQIATGSMGQSGASPDVKKGYEKQRKKGISKLIRRRAGTRDAVSKLTGTARVPAREEVSEVTQSAIKKPMNVTGPDGKVRTVMKRAKDVATDDHGQEKIRENKKADLMKKLAKSAAASKKGKEAVSLKKAPWDKNESVEQLDELSPKTLKSYQKKADRDAGKSFNKAGGIEDKEDDKGRNVWSGNNKASQKHGNLMRRGEKRSQGADLARKKLINKGHKSPKMSYEEVELDEAVKVGNMKLKDGSSMKVTKEDAKLLNQMFKGLNNQNRKQMEKVMMTDKSGFNEIVGFAREAM